MLKPDIVNELQDLRYLNWSKGRRSSGMAGSYLKAFDDSGEKKIYYKLSYFDPVKGITGHECINELIVCRLLDVLGVEHLAYQLIHALIQIDGTEHETWLCASEDFKSRGDSKIALDDYYELEKNKDETIMEFCRRKGWEDYIYKMLVVDYLILNRDRHGANIEILKSGSNGAVRPAQLFDHGISLIYNCKTEEDVKKVKPLEDKVVQCFVGSRSARENLELIPSDKRPEIRALEKRDRSLIFGGLDQAMPKFFQNKIWKLISERWKVYENLQNNR